MKSLKIFLLSLVLMFAIGIVVSAQETPEITEVTVNEAINLDENVQPQDLETSEPNLLPDSPFYFLKEWRRSIQLFFTFSALKKAELKEKFASQKLLELKKLIEQNKNREKIERAIQLYQQEIGEVERLTQKIRERAQENEQVGKFLDKFIQHQILHQRILENLEKKVPAEIYEKIKEAREKHLEKFSEAMTRLENKERLQERLEKNLQEIKGSQFKNFKNLEILLELEEKVPEEAKEAIQRAQENALKRLQGDLEKMSPEDQERFKEYIEKISGDKQKQLEIMENIRARIRESTSTPIRIELQERLEEGRQKIIEKIEEKVKERGIQPPKSSQPEVCIQVITPAISPEGICKEFPTPCDVPEGWKKVEKCPGTSTKSPTE